MTFEGNTATEKLDSYMALMPLGLKSSVRFGVEPNRWSSDWSRVGGCVSVFVFFLNRGV